MEKGKEIVVTGQKRPITPVTKHARTHQAELSEFLPDLWFNILSRVPVTTLVRAKFTCKLWYTIITDPDFQESHLTRSLKNPPGHLYDIGGTVHFSDSPTLRITTHAVLDLCLCLSSCRGLLAYHSFLDSSFYICNPVTNDCIKTPHPPDSPFPIRYQLRYAPVLGYAPVTNKYKYVLFTDHFHQGRETFKCNIFTLGEKYWREVAVPNDIKPWISKPVYKNGCFYLMVSCVHGDKESRVMSFDLDTEKFRQRRIFHPDYLTLIGETVTLMVINQNLTQDVWMLTNEADDIWVKNYCFRFEIPRFNSNIMDFILSELWVKRNENELGPDSVCGELTRRGMNNLKGFDGNVLAAILLKLPITNSEDIFSIRFIIAHVGSLVSPSKIVAAAMKQPSSASSSKRE